MYTIFSTNLAHVERIDQTDHDLDHPQIRTVPFGDIAQDLYSTGPTQEKCLRSRRLFGAHPAT